MALSNHSSRTYLDDLEFDGLLNVLADRIALEDADQPIYLGAHLALNLIRNHRFETQADFMRLFDRQLQNFEPDESKEESNEESKLE